MSSVRLLKNGIEAFPAMFTAINQSQSSIALEMYVIADDSTGRELNRHLVAVAGRGVQVQVLVDAWGSWQLPDSFWNELREAGGRVQWFHPITKGLLPFRNHRKMLLIDDHLAYMGGMNVADEYYQGAAGEIAWRDNMLEISGVDIAGLRTSFNGMWDKAQRPLRRLLLSFRRDRVSQAIPSGKIRFLESGPDDPLRPVRRLFRQVIQSAEGNIDLAMGYFYPHGRIIRALRRAVKRGVRVRLLFSEKNDVPMARWAARGLYGRLLRAGMEVWEYRPSMMHAKLTIADNTLIAGSANLDIRSSMINYELVAVVQDKELAARARADFESDLLQSVRIEFAEWKKRPLIQRLKERFSYCLLARGDILFSRSGLVKRVGKPEHDT